MRFKEAAILLPEVGGDGRTFTVRESKGFGLTEPIGRDSPLVAALLEVGEPVQDGALRRRLLSDSAKQRELAAWSEAGAQMWVPLVQQKQIEGLLILGNKLADGFFTKADHHALGTLAHQAAVALARAELVDRLQGQIHEIQALAQQVIALQERNEQRLSQELHDDVVQDLVFVLRLLEEPVETHSPRKIIGARDVIQQTVDRLRDLMFELRPPSLGDDLEEALREYVASFRRRRGVPVEFHTHGNGVAVSKEVRVALFRICQEGLHNAISQLQTAPSGPLPVEEPAGEFMVVLAAPSLNLRYGPSLESERVGDIPQGTTVVVAKGNSLLREIGVLSLYDPAHPRRVTESGEKQAVHRYPDWSPDGQWIVFESERDGNSEVYIVPARGGLMANLTQSPKSSDSAPAWSR